MKPEDPSTELSGFTPPGEVTEHHQQGLQEARAVQDEHHWRPRRLPVVPLPQRGESLFSWADHLASCYEVDRKQIMDRLGLRPMTVHAAQLARHTAELPLAAARSLHAATGLEPEWLRDMTLYGIVEDSSGRLNRHDEFRWAPEETWAFCPQCLHPPARWPLWWYQSWAVMCPVHDCYTASFCPDCGSPFSPSTLRGDTAGTCPGFLSRPDDRFAESPSKRRPKRRRCGRPLWEIDTPPVVDPVVREVHQTLIGHLAAVRSGQPGATQQWFDDFRTLRILLRDPEPLHVRVFSSPDPALRERYTDASLDDSWDVDDDEEEHIQWQPSESGFLHPWWHTTIGSRRIEREPITTAAEFSVIGRILHSSDMASAARDAFDVPHRAGLRSFDNTLPSYLSRTSLQLHGLLGQALDADALDQVLGSAHPPPA